MVRGLGERHLNGSVKGGSVKDMRVNGYKGIQKGFEGYEMYERK